MGILSVVQQKDQITAYAMIEEVYESLCWHSLIYHSSSFHHHHHDHCSAGDTALMSRFHKGLLFTGDDKHQGFHRSCVLYFVSLSFSSSHLF